MLRFFRKIRQRLLTDNKFSKYLLYAIGEILLVVIGILIALSINNWNSYTVDRSSEADYLKRLSNDLARDTSNYSWTSRDAFVKQEALAELLAYLKNHQGEKLDSTYLIKKIFQGRNLSFAHPKVTTDTFEELKNTGSFKLIRSTNLRSAINNYYFSREHQYFRIEKKRTKPSFGDEIDRIIPGLERSDGIVKYRDDLVSLEEITKSLNKPEFRKIMVSEFNLAAFMYNIQIGGLEKSKDLLNLINIEIAAGEK